MAKKGGGKKGGKKGGGGGGGGGGGVYSLDKMFNLGAQLAHPVQQTRADINLQYGPQIRGLKQDYRKYAGQMGSLYEVLGNQLRPMSKQAAGDYGDINQGYTKGTTDIIGALGQSTAPDAAAYLNTLGAQSLAGSRALGTMGTEDVRNAQSMGQQGALENMILHRNASTDLRDALGELRKQKRTDFRSQLYSNRDQAFQRMLALMEYRLRQQAVGSQLQGDKALRGYYKGVTGAALDVHPNTPNHPHPPGTPPHHHGGGGGGGGIPNASGGYHPRP